MKAEYKMLARQFGPMIARFDADVGAAQELMAIFEWRFSKLTGLQIGTPAFDEAVKPVEELLYDVATASGWDDESQHLDPMTPPTEELYGDMPVKLWVVTPVDASGEITFLQQYVRARTDIEAARIYEANNGGWPEGSHGFHAEEA